jgi:GNAT superfamily N-acetyltransferase
MRLLGRCIEDMRRRGIDQWDELYPTRERFLSDVSAASLYLALMGQERVIGAFTLDQNQDAEYASVQWTMSNGSVAVVHRLMVDPDYQGRGIAQEMMRFAEHAAWSVGCGVMRLDAFASNPQALRLYRTLDYRDAGEVRFRKGAFLCFEKRLDSVKQESQPT